MVDRARVARVGGAAAGVFEPRDLEYLSKAEVLQVLVPDWDAEADVSIVQ